MPYPRLDEDGRPRDALGRIEPHQLNAVSFTRTMPSVVEDAGGLVRIPGFLAQFNKRVPDEFISLDRDEETDEMLAVIACPCGGTPKVRVGGIGGCDCERVFVYTGQIVLVAKGDGQGPRTDLAHRPRSTGPPGVIRTAN